MDEARARYWTSVIEMFPRRFFCESTTARDDIPRVLMASTASMTRRSDWMEITSVVPMESSDIWEVSEFWGYNMGGIDYGFGIERFKIWISPDIFPEMLE